MPFPIAYFAGSFPARSETFVYREVRELRRRGWEVSTVSLNDPREKNLPEFADLEAGNLIVYGGGGSQTFGSTVAEFLTRPIRSTRTFMMAMCDAIAPGEAMSMSARLKLLPQALAAIGVARRLAGAGVRHIHAHFAHAPATLGMYVAGQLGVPFSFTGHANDLFQRRALLRKKLHRAAFVACISAWHGEFYKSAGVDEKKCHVIRCGVPITEWTPRQTRGEVHHNHQRIELLTVCRLVEKKGVDTLIRAVKEFNDPQRPFANAGSFANAGAFAKAGGFANAGAFAKAGAFANAGRELHLTIAGDGPESDSLRNLADELQVTQACSFLGAVNNDRVRELLGQADYFALPCRTDSNGDRDGIPVVLMEAMACGVPVISGDLPAIRELITHRKSGVLVNGKTGDEIAAAIAELERDESFRIQISRAGRLRVETEFSLEENVTRLENVFCGVGASPALKI